jgi:hypothetical protein
MTMRERDIEKFLIQFASRFGGEVRKVKWINRRGAPDRVLLLEGVHFIELKAPGKKPEDYQLREHNRMREKGANVVVIDTMQGVKEFVWGVLRGE